MTITEAPTNALSLLIYLTVVVALVVAGCGWKRWHKQKPRQPFD